jgi:hypothetical protein
MLQGSYESYAGCELCNQAIDVPACTNNSLAKLAADGRARQLGAIIMHTNYPWTMDTHQNVGDAWGP